MMAASLLAAILIGAQWIAFGQARQTSEMLVMSQAQSFVRQLRRAGLKSARDGALDELLEDNREDGLKHIAIVRGTNVLASAGERQFDGPATQRFERRGDLVRVRVPLRQRRARGPNAHKRGPLAIVEFVPEWSLRNEASARRSLGLSFLAGLILVAGAFALSRTARRAAEAEARAAHDAHLKSLGQMSAVLAHEIKNPLAALKGHAQLLEELLEDERAQKKAAVVVEETKRIQKLVEDLLAFAKTSDLNRTEVNLLEVAQRVAARHDRVRVTGAAKRLSLDEGRVEQVLENLVQNALEWSDDEVVVEVGARGFSVLDQGPGLPAGKAREIFKPFFTGRVKGGVGLGLAFAKRVVELHGGRIEAHDRKAGGARFTVTF